MPTTWLVTLDSILSVSCLAGVALFYRWYGKHWREPDEITKILLSNPKISELTLIDVQTGEAFGHYSRELLEALQRLERQPSVHSHWK